MKKYLLITFLLSCHGSSPNMPLRPFIITSKYIIREYNGKISQDILYGGWTKYYYNTDWEFEDSTGKYNVGDTLK